MKSLFNKNDKDNLSLQTIQDDTKEHFRLHVGMRTTKTVLGVFISGVIATLINQSPLFSMFACILCMQNQSNNSFQSAFNRMIATFIGGTYSLILIFICLTFGIPLNSFIYYTMISLSIYLTINTALFFKRPLACATSCIVFVAITLSEFTDLNPMLTALWRVINTLIGLGIVVILEMIFPYSVDDKDDTPIKEIDVNTIDETDETEIK